ncbi:hypothetical protein, partial [Flavobacterium pedocola]
MLLLLFCGLGVYSQSGNDFKQFANDPQEKWINSILQQNNSTYYEGTSTLQRFVLVGIPATANNQHVLKISHLATKGGHHAYDFITGYDRALIDYQIISNTAGFTGLSVNGGAIGPPATAAIINNLYTGANNIVAGVPLATAYGSTLGQSVADRVAAYDVAVGGSSKRGVQLYGNAAITSAELVFVGYNNDDGISGEAYAHYELRWTSSSTNILFLFAGHLSLGNNFPNYPGVHYGTGLGAASINGGPYHFKLSTLDGASLGSQDNQIKASDIVIPPPPCTIAPQEQTICESDADPSFSGPPGLQSYSWTISPQTQLSGANTQTVTVVNPAPGTYTLTLVTSNFGIVSIGDCKARLIVIEQPNAGTDGSTAVCVGSNAVINLFDLISGEDPGGTWTDTSGSGGVFDAVAGTYTLAPGATTPRVFTYTVTGTAPCGNDSSTATVNINPLPSITCPSNSLFNQVVCGVSASESQSNTNADFATWFDAFATANPGVTPTVEYVYTPAAADPGGGNHAPLNPGTGVPGFTETSVTVTWMVQDSNGCITFCSAVFTVS